MAASAAARRTRVLEFERVSTDQQELKRQAADLKRNREQFNLETLRTIRVKVSGTKVMSNEDVKRMYAELSDPAVDGVSVSAIDRLFRPKDFAQISDVLQFFHSHHKLIVSTVEGLVEPWTANGWTTCMTAAMKAGSEWHELKRRTKGGRETARGENKSTAPNPAYGLKYISKHHLDENGNGQYYIEDPAPTNVAGITRRQIIERIFDLRYRQRLTPAAIGKIITATGVLSHGQKRKDGSFRHRPGPWTATTIRLILQNRHYIGEHWEKETLVECMCPAFISRPVFDAVQKMWTSDLGNGRPAIKHLLSSYLRCGCCGYRMRLCGGRYKSYRCGDPKDIGRRHCPRLNTNISCSKIETIVWRKIWSAISQPDLLLRSAERYYNSQPKADGLSKMQDDVKTLKREIEDVQYMVRKRAMEREQGTTVILDCQRQIAQLESEMRSIGTVITLPTAEQARAGCRLIADPEAEPETFAERRPILEQLTDFQCSYDGAEVVIEGKIPVPVSLVQNRQSTLNRTSGSVLHIPFKIKERVA